MMGRAMRAVSMDMDMDMGRTEEKRRGMHMRRYLGGKAIVVVAAAVAGSKKGRRRHDQGKGLVGKVLDALTMGMIQKYNYDTERVLGAVVATDTQHVRLCHDRHMYDIACMHNDDQQNSTQHDAVIAH